MASSIAVQRPMWESNQIMREELATVLSNRSVAFLEAGDPLSALVDAEHVINLKRPWSKGHFRKAKALIALQEYEEARDAVNVGLQFEPKSGVRSRLIPACNLADHPTLTGDVDSLGEHREVDQGIIVMTSRSSSVTPWFCRCSSIPAPICIPHHRGEPPFIYFSLYLDPH